MKWRVERKVWVAAIVCAVLAGLVLATADEKLPFYGVGLLVEISYLLVLAYSCWQLTGTRWLKGLAILIAAVLAAVASTYVGTVAFGKLTFDVITVAINFAAHLVLGLGFLGVVWLIARFMPSPAASVQK